MRSKSVWLLALCVSLGGCATNAKKRNLLTAGSFAAGAMIGASTTPSDEKTEMHAMLWGSAAGLLAAIVGNSIYSDEDSRLLLEKDNQKLKAELDLIQTGNKILLDQGSGKFKNPTGEMDVQGQKANWKVYQVDRWVKDGPSRLYHQDKMIEITPVDAKK